jgi:C1A family cysteine protease
MFALMTCGLVAVAAKFNVAVDVDDARISARSRYMSWKKKHGKTYSVDEEKDVYNNWELNDKYIQKTNAKKLSYTVGHNEFSDLSWYQFSKLYVGGYESNPHLRRRKNYNMALKNVTAPDSVDWSTKGAVTPIKNQAQCGSCWAFSTTGSLEGAYAIASGDLVSLSEQDLVSCDKVDNGCQGGLMDNAFGWIKKNGGICSEADYKYTSGSGQSGICEKTCQNVVTLTGFEDVPSKDEDALAAAVAKQPVSVAIEADKSAFQLYKSGVFTSESCGTQLDHGVLVVGYGTESGKQYWKVKNSWGATWGMEGYILIERGDNICGISQQPSYPTGAKKAGSGPTPSPSPSPPSPSPSPTPPGPAGKTHYGDPNIGACESDEVNITITGITGAVCSPKCTGFIIKTKCPSDVPEGVTATPTCALEDSASDEKYCALICSQDLHITKAEDDTCGKASCKTIPNQGVGICTYDN